MLYKRPTIRKRSQGSITSVISPYSTGVLGDIARSMLNTTIPPLRKREWTPPTDYEFIAKKLPKEEGEALIARSKAWLEAHTNPVREPVVKTVLNYEPIMALHNKYPGKRPPLEEHIAAFLAAGMSEARVEKYRAHMKKMEDTSDERQKALDSIFAKYPSANKPNKPKAKKIIKAVHKKINNGSTTAA